MRIPPDNIRLKRVYEPSDTKDPRILVDRLWPRGLKKEVAAIDHWAKDLAPSTELRKWFHHDPTQWSEFRHRYTVELAQRHAELDQLRSLARQGPVTLVYSARDEQHNQAIVLREILLNGSS